MNQHTTTRTSPARRDSRTQRPAPLHLLHHREVDGTAHTLCGLVLPRAGATVQARRGDTCPACQAAAHLWEVMP